MDPSPTTSVFQRLTDRLRSSSANYTVLRHEAVYTSAEAAAIRGTTLSSGAKALICKVDEGFVMFVMPADLKLASKAIRKREGIRRLRFASREEVTELTALEPGSIPPFGSLFGLPTWCDDQLRQQETINFNAGDHGISISMPFLEYARVESPKMGSYGEPG